MNNKLIENTTDALEAEETRLAIEVYRSDYLPIIQNQYIDVVEENNRRKYGKIKNTTEALASEFDRLEQAYRESAMDLDSQDDSFLRLAMECNDVLKEVERRKGGE